jgi:ribonucleoside-diphosphate reductase alpha chain
METMQEIKKEEQEYSGLKFDKYFHTGPENVYDTVNWTKGEVQIKDYDGKIKFTQKDVEAPDFWSPLARKVVAEKYFYGEINTDEREGSIKTLIDRVTGTIADYGLKDGYFDKENRDIFYNELSKLCLDQKVAFNSPVWFNVGTHRYESRKKGGNTGWIIAKEDRTVDYETPYGNVKFDVKAGQSIPIPKDEGHLYPQTSACFIQHVDDTMEDIMNLCVKEAMLFKYGSGTGSDLSTLRSSKEKLSGGGKPSGPLAYLIHWDKLAGIVKSGGKTRRAAKMDSLKTEHPDIKEFIGAKMYQEELINALADLGYDPQEIRDNMHFQNTNVSVRASDEFMNAVENNGKWKTKPVHNLDMKDEMPEYKARDLMDMIGEGTYICGDPGMQFHTTINKWHTCPNTAEINASNPCSEYMFVNDSSCNLASLNLMKFLKEDETFDIEAFKNASRVLTVAQELLYDNSSFPEKEIAENSHLNRPLGQGYANLGSLLMFLGQPYDSDSGRDIAASITSLLASNVYKTSAEMAEKFGPFNEFEKNREPMLNVMSMHKAASDNLVDKLKDIDEKVPHFNTREIGSEADALWFDVMRQGSRYGFRNAQSTVLAPTGTIGFMMDCDTTGVEPDLALIKYKLLSDGGYLKLVNQTVKPALKRLGYSNREIDHLENHLLEKGTLEGSLLEKEHLPIFDCSFKCGSGKKRRFISPMGHVDMMARIQPFLSGAISKTVNMPKEATKEEIKDIYMQAWKSGVKAVAVYRDESKRMQPLSTSKHGLLESKVKPIRRKLPNDRMSVTHKFAISGHEGYLTLGLYPDGGVGETFLTMNKEGSTIGGLAATLGTLTSMALQYGVPVETLASKFKGQKFEPSGLTFGHPDINTSKSITDYFFNLLETVFVKGNTNGLDAYPGADKLIKEYVAKNYPQNGGEEEVVKKIEIKNTSKNIPQIIEGATLCPICSSPMTSKGKCGYVCSNDECNHVDDAECCK